MKTFDDSKPYSHVRGIPGVVYEQDSQLFNSQKQPVDDQGELLEKTAKQADTPEPDGATEPATKSKTKARKPANQAGTPEGVRPLREQGQGDA